MGLFDFLKSSGPNLFSSPADAGRKIEEHIRTNNPGIKGLKAIFKRGTVYLSGDAQDPDALQKAVLMAGNLQGVESVNVDGIKIPSHSISPKAVENYQGTQYYIVRSGDTLSKIAQRFYGNPDYYSELFNANREVIRDPNLIFPGQKIRIPAKNTAAAS